MAEYYPLLARAVSAQPNATQEVRNGIYERARKALLGQLRAHDPPLPDEDIQREARALEEAIARVEGEQAQAPASPPAPPPAKAETAAKAESPTPPRLTPKPMSLAERAKAHRASLAAGGPRLQPTGAAVAAGPATRELAPGPALAAAATASAPAELRADKSGSLRAEAAPIYADRAGDRRDAPMIRADSKAEPIAERRAIPRSGLLWKLGRSRADGETSGPIVVPAPSEGSKAGFQSGAADAEAEADAAIDSQPTYREGKQPLRAEGTRPLAPLARPERRQSPLYWILGAGGAAIVLGVAVLAFFLRDEPQTISPSKTEPVAAAHAPGKIVDRIGVGPTHLPEVAGASGSTALGGGAPPPVPSTGSAAAPAAGAAPASGSEAASAPANGADATQVAPVAQRAALLVQSPTASDPQAISTYVGTVVWRVDSKSDGPGQPSDPVVDAVIDVPQAKFKASMLFEKNTDPSLPASHTIELRFIPEPGSAIGDVKQIDTPQMRKEESPAGDPLSGIATPITANYFLVGLTKGDPAQSHNLDLIRSAGWFDVPMLLANGKIAKITFEKGVPGQNALDDAMAAWSK